MVGRYSINATCRDALKAVARVYATRSKDKITFNFAGSHVRAALAAFDGGNVDAAIVARVILSRVDGGGPPRPGEHRLSAGDPSPSFGGSG